jgi:hypothetical protein
MSEANVSHLQLSVLNPWMHQISQMDATFCHMQLTELRSLVLRQPMEKTVAPEAYYNARMELRQKLNQWIQKDSLLSVECQKIGYDVQSEWRQREETLLSLQLREEFSEQRVFTDSHRQLYSNPYLIDAGGVTSVSELQNGDVVVADDRVSVIAKTESGEMRSWYPDTPGRWAQLSLHHSMGWLKQPAKRVVVLRHWNSQKAEQLVRWVQAQHEQRSQKREPSSAWMELSSFLQSSPELPLEANPHFHQVFEWRNHSAIGKH